MVRVGSFDGNIYIVDAKTGGLDWSVKTGGEIFTTPLVADGRAYVGSSDKSLYVLALADRRMETKLNLGGKIYASPRLMGGSVVVGSTSGTLAFIDRESLAVTDRGQLPERVVNSVVVLPDKQMLVAPTADNRWFGFQVVPMEEDEPDRDPEESAVVDAANLPFDRLIRGAYQEGAYFRLPARADEPRPPVSRRLLGAAATLWARSPEHATASIADMESRLARPLALGQARVFLRGLHPVGYVSWARLSGEAAERFERTGLLTRGDWQSGDHLWLVDLVAPDGGGEEMVAKVENHLLDGGVLRRRSPTAGSVDRAADPPFTLFAQPRPVGGSTADQNLAPSEGVRYLVCTTPRTGSTMLCDALASTGIAGRPDEYFHRDCRDWKQQFGIMCDRNYISELIRNTVTANGVFGIKLHWRQWNALIPMMAAATGKPSEPIRDELPGLLRATLGAPRYVWLRRRNSIAQGISLYRAANTGFWRAVAGRNDQDCPADRALSYDFKKILGFVRQVEAEDGNWGAYFRLYRLAPLMLFYEDLAESCEPMARSVLRYLGLPFEDVVVAPPTLARQADERSLEWEERYRRAAD